MNGFGALLSVELRKALGRNLWFWGAVLSGVGIAVYAAVYDNAIFQDTLAMTYRFGDTLETGYSSSSCFSFWLPIRTYEFAPGIFMMVWPLLVSIPYAWSWSAERRSGMLDQEYARAQRVPCYLAKILATYVAGALALGIPFVASLAISACFAPAEPVWVSDMLYIGVWRDAPFSSLFYTNPLAFCALWTLIASSIAGLWACAVAAFSMVVGNFLETLIASYLFLQVLAFVGEQLSFLVGSTFAGLDTYSALYSLDLFSVVSVRSSHDSLAALLITFPLLMFVSAVIPVLTLRRDSL